MNPLDKLKDIIEQLQMNGDKLTGMTYHKYDIRSILTECYDAKVPQWQIEAVLRQVEVDWSIF